MNRLYKFGIWLLLICLGSITCNGQVGITKTERSNPKGIVTFAESSTISGISNSKHIDGYVRKLGHSVFTFPVGHQGFYRPFAAESNGTTGAYFRGDPGQAALPAGSPFNRNTRDSSLSAVSTVEYWDIIGSEPTKLTLSWNVESDLTTLTGGSVDLVTIAGWSKSNARWEKITSLRDQTSITGGASTISTGSVTSVQAVDLKNYSAFTLGSGLSESVASNFDGNFESVASSEIKGWVWDQNYPNADLTIELYEGETVYASVKANVFRSDLKDNGKGTGYYGFKIAIPATLKDGKVHQLSARVRGSSYILNGSPKQVSYLFEGQIEVLDCYRIKGWVWDKQNPISTIDVEMVEGGIVRATISASQFRQDLSSAGKGSGNYGFEIALPTSLRDGKPHQFDFRVKGSLYSLVGSPKSINCSTSQYYGSINALDCSTVQGWVWDKTYPDSALTIELYEGSTVHATVVANAYRADVKSAGYGTGKYGFNFALPASLKDGQPHQVSLRVKGSSFNIGTARSVTCFTKLYEGSFEGGDCTSLRGWVWDKNHPESALVVELLDGSTVHSIYNANVFRSDLQSAGTGTGKYGFNIPLPANLRDGNPHQLSIRVQGTTYVLSGSPRTLTCSVPSQYYGSINALDCSTVQGWVWDKSYPDSALTIELYEGSTVHATVVANAYRADVKSAGYGTGKYGFNFALPASLKDGQPHQVSLRVKGSSFNIGTARSVTCFTKLYEGSFEGGDCTSLRGWVWDKNHPESALVVELLDGSTVHSIYNANVFRSDLQSAGTGTGKYGFNIPLPANLRDGNPHQLSIRVQGTTYVLSGSPRTLTCSIPSQYYGSINALDCSTVQGWVWDKSYPDSALTIELYEGSTVHATVVANAYRADVKSAGYGTGKYGFNFALPASLKDGQPHQVSLRVKGSSFNIGTARSVTCFTKLYEGSFEGGDCTSLRGWVWDKNHPESALVVELLDGSTVHSIYNANVFRSDLQSAGTGTGKYGFNIPLPANLRDGNPHQLSIRVQGTTYVLSGSPRTLTCSIPSQYYGSINALDCSTVQGWVWDKSYPDSALTIELYEGSTVHATVVANAYRADVKSAGYGTGKYGFNFALPASLKDGQPHQVSLRVKGSSFNIGTARSVTCFTKLYGGSFEGGDCTRLRGWVWDKNHPESALVVELLDGSTVHSIYNANVFRSDLQSAGTGTGKYGFNIPLPANLRDGNPHQLSIRVQGTTYVLSGSPRTLTCSVPSQYYGSINVLDCSTVQGWVWDKTYPDSALTIELYEGSTVHATVVANAYRADVKSAGYGTGKYGFNFALPASLKDGQPHQVSLRVKGSSFNIGTARSVTCFTKLYEGSFEGGDCTSLRGWVWDKNHPESALVVELLDGSTVHSIYNANVFRSDLQSAGTGTGKYGFNIPLPANLRDGNPHQLSIRVQGTTYVLSGSPRTLTCSVPSQYYGSINALDCSTVQGWVWDKSYPDSALTIELYEGSTVHATVVANAYRADVKSAGYGTGKYGFNFALPASLKDGQPHQVSLRVKGSSFNIGTARSVTCFTKLYEGSFEGGDCTSLRGWVWDKNHPESALVVELLDGSTVHSIYNANVFRSDLQSAGTGTGKYGFNISLPANLRDGNPHQLSIRVQGTTYVLSGSPRTLTCSIPSQYYGSINVLDCSTVQGWAWDKTYPDSSVTIELYEGSTMRATVVANAYRADVKSAGYGTGNYGFSFALPASLKDGQPHQLSVRVKNSSYTLNNSPKTITCAITARIAVPDVPSQEVEKIFPEMGEQPEFDIDLVISPNPTKGKITASYSLGVNVSAELTITNIVGRQVWRQVVKGTGERVEMPYDFEKLPDGVYIMQIAATGQKVMAKRIVLTK